MGKKHIFLLLAALLLSLGFGLRASSHGELRVIMHQQHENISKIEIVTSNQIEEMIVEVFDASNEMTHYLILESPLQRKHNQVYANTFYLTDQITDLQNLNNIIIYPQNNEGVSYNQSEMEVQQEINYDSELAEGSEEPVKIMSYNIHHGKSLTGRHTLDEMAELIRESGAEIIGLQEVDSSVPRSKLKNQIKYLAQALEMYYAYGENVSIYGGRYGNGILSKYPIEYSENLLLPSNREQRGLLNSIINVNGRRINFMVTHLGLNSEERQKQLKSIQSYMGTLFNEVILVGDFNTLPGDSALNELKRKMVDLGWAMGQNETPTFDFPFLSKRIDYIFVPPGYEIIDYEVMKSRASDHYPITGTILFPKN